MFQFGVYSAAIILKFQCLSHLFGRFLMMFILNASSDWASTGDFNDIISQEEK